MALLTKELLAIAFLWWAAASSVHASCCSATSASSVGRLQKHERAAITLAHQTSYLAAVFSSTGTRQPRPRRDLPHLIFTNDLGLIFRLLPYVEPVAKVPLLVQVTRHRVGGGLGDVSLGARFNILPYEIRDLWPKVSLVLLTKLPTGKAANAPHEDITGFGLPWILPSLLLESSVKNYMLGLNYGAEIPVVTAEHRQELVPGFMQNVVASVNRPLFGRSTGGLNVSYIWHAPMKVENTRVPNSERRKLNVGLNLQLPLSSLVSVQTHAGADLPFNHWGKNVGTQIVAGVSLRLGVY
jgi:hypothetical protein